MPVLAWLGALQLIALVTLPLTFFVFRPLSDKGYLLGKALGILLVGLVVWLLASLQWVAFSHELLSRLRLFSWPRCRLEFLRSSGRRSVTFVRAALVGACW